MARYLRKWISRSRRIRFVACVCSLRSSAQLLNSLRSIFYCLQFRLRKRLFIFYAESTYLYVFFTFNCINVQTHIERIIGTQKIIKNLWIHWCIRLVYTMLTFESGHSTVKCAFQTRVNVAYWRTEIWWKISIWNLFSVHRNGRIITIAVVAQMCLRYIDSPTSSVRFHYLRVIAKPCFGYCNVLVKVHQIYAEKHF